MNAKQTRLRWAVALIRRGRALGALPRYGSPHWCSLPDSDPRKVAAVVVAAECWWVECDKDHIAQRLQDELTVERQIQAGREAQQFADVAAQVRRRADTPTWAKVRERWGVGA